MSFPRSTAIREAQPTITIGGGKRTRQRDRELIAAYDEIATLEKITWTGHHRKGRLLGAGGQGEVYLSEHRGTDGFTVPVAIKVFSPEHYETAVAYGETMRRIATMAGRIALIQHDNLLGVQNFYERRGIRMMLMEWIDGYDVRYLCESSTLESLRDRVDRRRWSYVNEVIQTAGPTQSRFKPGVAVAIVRDCLAALAALHRNDIVHGDIKPSNIMMKLSGHAKLIDIGSAFDHTRPPRRRDCTPPYAAPEVLEELPSTPRSDLASLGYVLVELLAGREPHGFESDTQPSIAALLEAKRSLPKRLSSILPDEVLRNERLMTFIHGLIAPDPTLRFPDAEAAEHVERGAAAFHRHLVLSHMATEYDNDVRVWLNEIKRMESPAI